VNGKQSALSKLLQEIRDASIVTESCLFCDWRYEGTALDGRAQALDHRKRKHPEAVGKKRARVRRSWPASNRRSDEENAAIAVDAAELNRVRAEREDGERLAKVLRARAREAA
jgi:hypothetical protein